MPTGKKVKFAIVGCGRIGKRHAEFASQYGQLVAVCDSDWGKAVELATQFKNVTPYNELPGMITACEHIIDVVSVCTPNGLHARHAILALTHGFHVLCEKPMANSCKDAAEMLRAAREQNRHLFIVKQNRFNPPVVAVKQLIDNSTLGKIFTIQLSCFWNRDAAYYKSSPWRGTRKFDGGTLYTQFSHFIDLLYWMFGEVKHVMAATDNFLHKDFVDFEDTGVALLRFQNGALATINYSVNSYNKNMEGSLTIIAEKGTVKIGGEYLNELEYQNIANYTIPDLPPGKKANEYGTYTGSMSNHDKVYENVVDVLTKGSPLSAGAFDGFKTVELIERIYHSAKQNENI